ncbi:MAG: DUF6275 family protein [Anaerorhabdus sp.]|uniref:DUF6275 family protein n=1 Tax=Anaerorhabdus sp. TaxID=1872524 RepID=UPI002FCB4EE2
MDTDAFNNRAKLAVSKLTGVPVYGIYVVWTCKILENNKSLLATTESDGLYFEVTHNGHTGEMYVDKYKKQLQDVIQIGER